MLTCTNYELTRTVRRAVLSLHSHTAAWLTVDRKRIVAGARATPEAVGAAFGAF